MDELTAERLRELLDYDPLTGIFKWKKRTGSRSVVGAVAGNSSRAGYVDMKVDGERNYAHRLAWLYVHGIRPEGVIDHMNGIRSDNRIANLRDVSLSVNAQNSINGHKDSKYSQLLGVTFCKRRQRYIAQIRATGNTGMKYIGSFRTPEEAHQAYLARKLEIHPGYIAQ